MIRQCFASLLPALLGAWRVLSRHRLSAGLPLKLTACLHRRLLAVYEAYVFLGLQVPAHMLHLPVQM